MIVNIDPSKPLREKKVAFLLFSSFILFISHRGDLVLEYEYEYQVVSLILSFPGNEMAERMAYFGLSVNMVAFMFYIMHRPFSSSANAVNNFLGISQASSVLGGFLADAYLGRYWTIAIFTTIYLAVRSVFKIRHDLSST